ncbi:hypothetical protein ACQKDL_19195 [Pseudomonas bubulae]
MGSSGEGKSLLLQSALGFACHPG